MNCSVGTYFDPAGLCRVANPLCKTFNENNGACLTCYVGFKRQGRLCVEDKDANNCA